MLRPLRFVPHLLLTLLLAAALGFALATRFPDAEILARAEGWPVAGPWVERFRLAYLPPAPPAPPASSEEAAGAERSPAGSGGSPAAAVEVVQVIDPDLVGIKPKVWARPGTPIRDAPDPAAREVGRVEHLFPLSRLERRGDWFRVRYGSRLSGLDKGWVHLPGYQEPSAEELNAPAPVLPLAAVGLSAGARTTALAHLAAPAIEGRCGPFPLLTDALAPATRAMCERVGSRVEAAYRARYGLELVGEAAETVLLFAEVDDFRSFRAAAAAGLGGDAFASAARGFVAVPVGGRLPAVAEANLVHELTHLLNRRALGPALPPWLDEGMARDLDTVGLDDAGSAPLRPPGGPPVESLEYLFALDGVDFQRRSERHYRAAGRWIGYLIAGPDASLRAGMRAFLRAVAAGEPIRAELLLAHLGREWSELEDGFRAWERTGPRVAVE